jgi:hypothetical protein
VREFQKWQDPLMSCTRAPLAKKRSFDAYATRPTHGRLKRNRKGRKVRGRGNARDLFFFFYYFYFLFRIMVFDSY